MSSAHLQRLESLLDGIISELAIAEGSHRTCLRAFDDAKLALAASEAQKSSLAQSRDSLQRAIRKARRGLCGASRLPDELLSLIFGHHAASYAIPDHEGYWHTDPVEHRDTAGEGIDWDLATLPDSIRLVCRRWNTVALSTSQLWTYIAIPPFEESDENGSFAAHLRLMLEHSRALALAVVIESDSEVPKKYGFAAAQRRLVYDLLGGEVHRIRTLEVYGDLPPNDKRPPHMPAFWDDCDGFQHLTMGLFRLPTPRLEEVLIRLCPVNEEEEEPWLPAPDDPLPLYLPVAPKLRRLRLDHLPVLCKLPHPGLPSLTVLSLGLGSMYEAHFLDMCTLCPALQELSLRIESLTRMPSAPHSEPRSITLPRLHSLRIGWQQSCVPCVKSLTFPNLTSLYSATYVLHDITPKLGQTLRKVVLTNGDLDEDDLAGIYPLPMIEEVEFLNESMDDRTLVDLLCGEDPIWPRLRKLVVVRCSVGPDHGAQLVRLVEHRNTGTGNTQPLETITVRKSEVASWVVAQLRLLLGHGNVTVL